MVTLCSVYKMGYEKAMVFSFYFSLALPAFRRVPELIFTLFWRNALTRLGDSVARIYLALISEIKFDCFSMSQNASYPFDCETAL